MNRFYSSVFLANKQLPSWHDGSYHAAMECSISSLFGLFLVFWHLGPCLCSSSEIGCIIRLKQLGQSHLTEAPMLKVIKSKPLVHIEDVQMQHVEQDVLDILSLGSEHVKATCRTRCPKTCG
ncbi:hypothetical protein QL285_056336 [Trifolium repens]|nr:hypothetical protein QL285_056336 [Trifolium repens]